MDLGSMLVLVLVGVGLGSFITKALFPRIVVREVEVEVEVRKHLSLSQFLDFAFSESPVDTIVSMGLVEEGVLREAEKAFALVRDGYRPSRVRNAFVFFNPTLNKTFTLSSRGWKDSSKTYHFYGQPIRRVRREEEPPY